MRIGIDIDDVITDTSIAMKEYIEKYDTDGEISKYMVEIMRGEIPTPRIKEFLEENGVKFFNKTNVKPDAVRVINNLLENGDEIFLITSRGEERFKGTEAMTLEFLEKNKIGYTKIFFNSHEKARICRENKIDIMIDDSAKFCVEIQNENMKSILFTSYVNKDIDVDVPRVNNWIELEEKLGEIKCLN